jgi:hypothetical protein
MKNKIIVAFIGLMSLFVFNGCSDYLDINFDPSNPQVAEGFAILPPMLAQMARGEAFDIRFAGQYTQNWALVSTNNAWDLHGYVPASDAGGEKWRSHYWSIGKNIDIIIEQATAKQQWDYVGVAKAIRAWSWQTTTDVHGEVILKQAWEPNRYVFDFDSQQDVYAEVVRLANEALTDLARTDGNVSTANLGRGDLTYKGDRNKWIKFVYSVLAHNAHRLTNKAGYDPAKVIEYCDKSLASNADNFNVPYSGTNSLDGNFFGPTRNNLGTFRPSAYILSLLDGTVFGGVKDPRMPLMITASADGTFRGVVPGKGDPTTSNTDTKRIPNMWGANPSAAVTTITGKYFFTDKADHPLLTYAEIQFIKAEAAFIKGDKALAYEAYKKGIIAHMDLAKVAAAARDAYMTSAAVPQTADALKLSDIMLQKYIACWVIGALETWADMRRYNYSNTVYTGFTPPATLYIDNSGKLAQRFRPRFNSEYVWNRESLNTIGGNDPDYHTKPVWFTQK